MENISVNKDTIQIIVSCLVLLSIFVEVVPIKLNPLSSIFKWVGNCMLGDIKKDIKDLSDRVDINEMDSIRWEILEFANTCRNGRRHTKDEFEHVISLNTKYHRLLEKTNQSNGVFDLEYEYIVKLYKHCQETNDFIM